MRNLSLTDPQLRLLVNDESFSTQLTLFSETLQTNPTKAEVMWVRKAGKEHEKMFEVGVQWTEIDPRDKSRFRVYINNEIKDRLK